MRKLVYQRSLPEVISGYTKVEDDWRTQEEGSDSRDMSKKDPVEWQITDGGESKQSGWLAVLIGGGTNRTRKKSLILYKDKNG